GPRSGGHGHRLPAGGRGGPARVPGRAALAPFGGGSLFAPDRLPGRAVLTPAMGAPATAVPVALESRPTGVPAGTAAADVLATDLDGLRHMVEGATASDVERALRTRRRDLADFAALLSPAAGDRLEEMASQAHAITTRRFGRVVRLFAPLYLSNQCVSTCTYCGFSAGNAIARRTLSPAEVAAEARELHHRGFRHVLLVSGEHARIVSRDYLVACVGAVAPLFPQV